MASEELTGIVGKILFFQKETGFTIFRAESSMCFVGKSTFEIKTGDRIRAFGKYTKSDRTGATQFSYDQIELDIPTDPRGLLRYAVEITSGLGEAKEEEIWQNFGSEWQTYPELPGIKTSSATLVNWKATLNRLKIAGDQSAVMGYLMGKGCTPKMATAAWEKWGAAGISIVSRNPYALTELPRYGFKDADALRAAFGITDGDHRRITAALFYSITTTCDRTGNTVVPFINILMEVKTNIGKYAHEDAIEAAETQLKDDKRIVVLFLDGNKRYATSQNFFAEKKIFDLFSRVES